jgi:carbamoyltransferase
VFKDLWIQPASGDAGGAVGAAYAAWHIWKNKERQVDPTQDSMNGAYIGPEYHSAEIMRMARRNNAVFDEYSDFDQLYQFVADRLSHGKIIGWFQGRMEYGPRALGNRSILGDPRHPQMQKRLNLKIKYREGFRPFAPSVLEEDIDEYFELNRSSPYMTLVAPVQKKRRNPLPENYTKMGMYERLYHLRSDIPAVTHVDYSARIQSVSKKTNPKYWELINAFKDKTGYGLLVNTSFNVRGEPIVCTPDDAYKCFMRTEMDYLVANNYMFDKLKQPEWIQSDDWKDEFSKD